MKRPAKVERSIQEKLKKQAKRYNKSYPGELVHLDTKRLPLLKGQKATDKRWLTIERLSLHLRICWKTIQTQN